MLPPDVILGAGPGWDTPFPDQAQTLAGHLAFQADGWHWPLLRAETLFWPRGLSIALTDSNPLVSLIAKLWTKFAGGQPVNLLGAWLALCWTLQALAAAYAARGLRLAAIPCLAAAALAVCWPALLVRMGHINLCGHFLILLALGLVFRRMHGAAGTASTWIAPTLLLLAAILVHPYLYEIDALVLAALPLQAAFERRSWRFDLAFYVASCVVPVAVLMLLSGPLGGGDKGFVTYSMNLLSPVWPQHSGVFGAGLPTVDATGGQYEGFNWLGAGVLLLAAAALAKQWSRPARPPAALLTVLAALALFSLSSRVYAGPVKLIDLGAKPWEDIFGTFRVPGRAFWPVGYAIMLGAVAGVARLPHAVALPLLAAAVGLQAIDTEPLRSTARHVWKQGSAIPTLPIPQGTLLFSVAPHPGCTADPATRGKAGVMLLRAVRQGARLGDIGVGRPPAWFKCENTLSDLTELPMQPGEVRAFYGPAVMAGFHSAWLGPDATCARQATAVVCGRGVGPILGTPVPPAPAPEPLVVPSRLAAAALASVLANGWRDGADGQRWSEGPRGTLLLPVPANTPLVLTIEASGIADREGGTREVEASIGQVSAGRFAMPDGQPAQIVLHIPPQPLGLVRVALDMNRPVDPLRRGLTAPVHRAGLRLLAVSLREEGSAAR